MARRTAMALAGWLLLLPAFGLAQAKGDASTQACLAPARTEFDPARDGLPWVNYGDFASPFGNCWGMCLLAVHDYQLRRAGGLEALAPQLVHSPLEADVLQQIVASLVQAEASESMAEGSGENRRLPLDDPSGIAAGVNRLRSSGVPEILIYQNATSGHANVLYGYDGLNLLIYDPNFPLETIRWPWTLAEGFGPHPKGGDFYGTLTHASSTPFAQFAVSAELDALRASCVSRELACVGRYPGITGRLHVSKDGRPVIVGRITRPADPDPDGDASPELGKVWATVNGQPLAQAEIKRRPGIDVFALVLPKGTKLDKGRQVRVVLLTADGRFAGYQDVSARPDGESLSGPPAPAPPGPVERERVIVSLPRLPSLFALLRPFGLGGR